VKLEKEPYLKFICLLLKRLKTIKAQVHQHELACRNGELILVVDDEDHIREITKKTLEIRGYKVITANNGKEAIALYKQKQRRNQGGSYGYDDAGYGWSGKHSGTA